MQTWIVINQNFAVVPRVISATKIKITRRLTNQIIIIIIIVIVIVIIIIIIIIIIDIDQFPNLFIYESHR